MTNKEKELLKKLKALADGGVGGEKDNAERKLNALMDKLGITEYELEENTVSKFIFKTKKDKYLNKLFHQLLSSLEDFENIRGYKTGMYEFTIFLTSAQTIELQAKYDFYCQKFQEDLEIFYLAFIGKNKLWYYTDEPIEENLTPEDKKKRFLANQMELGLQKHNFHKQIETKK